MEGTQLSVTPATFTARYSRSKAVEVLIANIVLMIAAVAIGVAAVLTKEERGLVSTVALLFVAFAAAALSITAINARKRFAPKDYVAYALHREGVYLPHVGVVPWEAVAGIVFKYPRVSARSQLMDTVYGIDGRSINVLLNPERTPAELSNAVKEAYGVKDLTTETVTTAYVGGLEGRTNTFLEALTYTHVAHPELIVVDSNDKWFLKKAAGARGVAENGL